MMILFFTGTGNSRFVANLLGDYLEDDVISMNDYLKKNVYGVFHSIKPYVFVIPSYMSRMPLKIEEFILNSSFDEHKEAYFIFTAGASIGRADYYCQKICKEKNFVYKGTKAIRMPANYVVMYDVLDKEYANEFANKQKDIIYDVAMEIKNKELNEDKSLLGNKFFSMFSPAFHKLMVNDKSFVVNEQCISCGQCVDLCPLNNIKLVDSKPQWNHDCMHCMTCISACPKKAIDYGKKTKNRHRYYLK